MAEIRVIRLINITSCKCIIHVVILRITPKIIEAQCLSSKLNGDRERRKGKRERDEHAARPRGRMILQEIGRASCRERV